MTPYLSCYGDVGELVALVGDFDLRSPVDVRAWYRVEWQAIAEALGFARELEESLAPLRGARDWLATTNQAGLDAFARWLSRTRPVLTDSHARAQASVLRELALRGQERGELWRVSIDPTTLPGGACYADGDQMLRAFYPDTAPGYFGPGWSGPPPRAESACGWTTLLVLHLGTFPWVYNTRLEATGPGLRWGSREVLPAVQGMQAMAAALTPEGNLRQDARQVAALWAHFAEQTRPLVARLPAFQPGHTTPGQLCRRGGLLHVHQGSLHLAGLDGPRGHIAAPAYNYIVRRFACFFGVRRATLRALGALSPALRQLAASAADPCLRQQVEEVLRAG
jgi:hypothetical protein